MTTTVTHNDAGNTMEATLFVAFELSEKTWQRACTTSHSQKPRQRTVTARHPERVLDEIAQAKRRLGLVETAPWSVAMKRDAKGSGSIGSCTPTGSLTRWWIPRRLRSIGANADGLDVRKLLSMLLRYHGGERQVWQVIQVPAVEAEDQGHLHQDLETFKQERASTITRIRGLLSSQGLRVAHLTKLPEQLDALRLWDGSPLTPGFRQRVLRV